jgi:hypothetical protein
MALSSAFAIDRVAYEYRSHTAAGEFIVTRDAVERHNQVRIPMSFDRASSSIRLNSDDRRGEVGMAAPRA